MDSNKFIMPKILYFGIGDYPSTHLHSHAFYQIEYCISGYINANINNKEILLKAGDCCIIPPELLHGFYDCNREYKYISLKFHFPKEIDFKIVNNSEIKYYIERIIELIENDLDISAYSVMGKNIIENYTHAIIHNVFLQPHIVQQESQFIAMCREEVCKHNYSINIDSLANYFNLTRSQFKYKFDKEYNNSNCTIKSFIDGILIELINKHMRYSALSISGIAEKMKFPNVYTFSRFYKRNTGMSPLEYRKQF